MLLGKKVNWVDGDRMGERDCYSSLSGLLVESIVVFSSDKKNYFFNCCIINSTPSEYPANWCCRLPVNREFATNRQCLPTPFPSSLASCSHKLFVGVLQLFHPILKSFHRFYETMFSNHHPSPLWNSCHPFLHPPIDHRTIVYARNSLARRWILS